MLKKIRLGTILLGLSSSALPVHASDSGCNEILRRAMYNTNIERRNFQWVENSYFLSSEAAENMDSFEKGNATALCEEAAQKSIDNMSVDGQIRFQTLTASASGSASYSRERFAEWHRSNCDSQKYQEARNNINSGRSYDEGRSNTQLNNEVYAYAHNVSREAIQAWSAC